VIVENEFEKLNDRKNHYHLVNDDIIQSLIRYYKLEHDNDEHKNEVLKFVKDTAMKGDTLD
jgi:hypothetical protein